MRGVPFLKKLAFVSANSTSRNQDYVKEIHRLTREGVDAVFDPIGGAHLWHSREALRHGGRVVGYGNTTSLRGEGLGSERTGRRNRLHGIPIYALYIVGGWPRH
jgi:NADPH:quinone reductase